MRIAFVTPWFRTLAQLYGHRLQQAGHDVLVVTTDRHFQDGYALCPELVGTIRDEGLTASTRVIAELRREVRRFAPDLVLEDSFTDPRWLGTGNPRARWMMVHDPAPHDSRHLRDGIGRRTLSTQRRSATGILTFSESSRVLLDRPGGPAVVATPLLSEMWDSLVRTSPGERRGFVCMGRVSSYKGFDIAIDAWRRLATEDRERHPLNVLASSGDSGILSSLEREPGIELRTGRFDFADVSSLLSGSVAMLVPYRAGSQSGVQLLALQHGMVPLVSELPGLVEYQPPSQPAVSTLDPLQWTARMREVVASDAQLHDDMRSHYERLTSDDRVLDAWAELLESADRRTQA